MRMAGLLFTAAVSSPVTALPLSLPTKATLFLSMPLRCWATLEHEIALQREVGCGGSEFRDRPEILRGWYLGPARAAGGSASVTKLVLAGGLDRLRSRHNCIVVAPSLIR